MLGNFGNTNHTKHMKTLYTEYYTEFPSIVADPDPTRGWQKLNIGDTCALVTGHLKLASATVGPAMYYRNVSIKISPLTTYTVTVKYNYHIANNNLILYLGKTEKGFEHGNGTIITDGSSGSDDPNVPSETVAVFRSGKLSGELWLSIAGAGAHDMRLSEISVKEEGNA